MGHYLPGMEPDAEPCMPDGDGDEWYTPPEVLRAVEAVSPGGAIDLDPCHAPRSLVQARHAIDVRQGGDGLRDPWPGAGLVWCNPPYSGVRPWLDRCRREAAARPVVALVPVRPETSAWWSCVWRCGATVLIHRGRLRFVAPDGTRPGGGMLTTCLLAWDRDLGVRLAAALRREGIDCVAVAEVTQ